MNKEEILESDIIFYLHLKEIVNHEQINNLRDGKQSKLIISLEELKEMVNGCSFNVSTDLKWVQREDLGEYYQLQDEIAVYGYVKKIEDKWFWSARIMEKYRKETNPIEGFAPTMENAMKIIDILCEETKTFMCLQQGDNNGE